MRITLGIAGLVAGAWTLLAAGPTLAQETKPIDEGTAAAFKAKGYDVKEKGEVAVLLEFTAGKAVTVTAKGDKQTDVHLFAYDDAKKELGKDDSAGPNCEIKFTPAKGGKVKFLIRNSGPGTSKVTLDVKVAG